MTIRDANLAGQWTALRCALRGREPQFVVRKCMPDQSVAWDVDLLPRVFVSADVLDEIKRQVPRSFAEHVLAPIRLRGAQ